MKIRKRLAALPLTALVSLASNAQHAPTPADEAAAARANAEQNQQLQQQRDAQQRDATVRAPAVRSTPPTFEGYVATVHAQFTHDTLFYLDDLTIGSRYTVRGFDGETMLAAEKGFYWRNELQWPIGQTGQALYAGIDYGRVFGPNTAFLAGTQLAGAVIGIRGGLPSRFMAFSYDLFVGTPVYKPSGFPTSRVTVGAQVTAQF